MSCTAILVNYFSHVDTANAVSSLLLDHPCLKVLVVDNSCDPSELHKLKSALPENVRVLCAESNLGFGRACNWAAQVSNSQYLFLMNPDSVVLPGCVDALTEVLNEHQDFGAVAPMQYMDNSCHWMISPSWFPTEIRAWVSEVAMHDKKLARKISAAVRRESVRYWTATSPIVQRALSGSMLMLRRSAVSESWPLFDPRFFMYFEDSDLCRRLRRGGFKMAMVPKAKGIHRWRNQSHKGPMMEQSAELYFSKYATGDFSWNIRSSQLAAARKGMPFNLGNLEEYPDGGYELSRCHPMIFELSPNPLMAPAIATISVNGKFESPHAVLERFEGALVYGRVAPLNGATDERNCHFYKFN